LMERLPVVYSGDWRHPVRQQLVRFAHNYSGD
jgi:hypothetical protein